MRTERLVNLRKEVDGRRQADVAKVLKIGAGTYSTYEQGTREPDHSMLIKLADYYDVSIDYLLGRSDQRSFRETPDINAQISSIIMQLKDANAVVTFKNSSIDQKARKAISASLEGLQSALSILVSDS